MRRLICVAFVLAAMTPLLQTAPAPREQQPPRATFRGRTELIPVDVSVLDAHREPVRGLLAADFTVFEDGKPRPIVAFSSVELPTAVSLGAAAPWVRDAAFDVITNNRPDEGRLVAILMDGSIPAGAATLVAKQIAQAVVDALGPGDLAAIVRSSIFGNDGLSQGFTADRSRLGEAIDSRFMGTTTSPDMTPTGFRSPSPVPGLLLYTRNQCEVVFDIARAMRDAPGRRKMLLFVGTRVGLVGELNMGGDIRHCRDEALHALGEANVTMHVVDPVGLLTTAVTADYITQDRVSPSLQQGWARQNQARIDELKVLPDATGGRVVANTNTPEKFMPAVINESRHYYLLGFEPAAPAGRQTFHAIKVQVRRAGVVVHARNGYESDTRPNAPTSAAQARAGVSDAPASEVAAALDGPLPRQDLPLSLSVSPFAAPDFRTAAVAVSLGVTLPAGTGARQLDITVAAFDINGKSVDVSHQTSMIPAAAATSGRAEAGLLARLDLPPGRYELRAAVRVEGSAAFGSVFSFVDVPAFAQEALTASGLVLHRSRATFVEGNPLAGILSIVPTVARVLSPGENISAFLRLHQSGTPQAVAVTTRIVDTMDRVVFDRRSNLAPDQFAARSADVDLPLPLRDLAAGHYLLTMTAARGELRVVRTVRFEVANKP